MDELIKQLRRIAKVSYGATIEEAREVCRVQREAIDALTSQQTELAALIEDNDSLRKSLNRESEARCALEDEVKALRKANRQLSNEKIREIARKYFWGGKLTTVDDLELAIRAALSAASDGGGDE